MNVVNLNIHYGRYNLSNRDHECIFSIPDVNTNHGQCVYVLIANLNTTYLFGGPSYVNIPNESSNGQVNVVCLDSLLQHVYLCLGFTMTPFFRLIREERNMEVYSVNLWTVLSRFIGTEEEVFVRRRYHELISKEHSDESFKHVSSGSRAEGLSFKDSDFDFMFIINNIGVSISNTGDDQESEIVMETGNIKPGFVRLRCKDTLKDNAYLRPALVEATNGLFLSSLLFRDALVDQISGSVAHGPCASTTKIAFQSVIEFDQMLCLSCKPWPAMEWRYRTRNQRWPSQTLIEEIIQEGCLLVPIGNPNSQHNFIEWRLSFSLAEKKLIHSFNHSQLLCYGLLKLYLKHVINSNDDVKDLFCSYFLKTSLFHCIEEESISWSKENLLDCFFICFRRLLKWVQQGYCPNYFIKENNMFEGKIFGPKQRILLQYLSKLYSEECDSLRMIPCLSPLYRESFHMRMPFEIEYRCDFELQSMDGALESMSSSRECITKLVIVGRMMQEETLDIDKCFMKFRYNNLSTFLIQHMYSDALRCTSNKTRYREIKGLKCFIIHNCPHVDECTRMLLLATLCYLKGEYSNVVNIVMDVLRQHGRYMCMMFNNQAYVDEICGKGLTIQQKINFGVFSYLLPFDRNCRFYPYEIEAELHHHALKNITLIPTVVYSNILLFLSFHHLNMEQNMNCVFNDLYVAVHIDNIPEELKPLSVSLLHKCLQISATHQNYA